MTTTTMPPIVTTTRAPGSPIARPWVAARTAVSGPAAAARSPARPTVVTSRPRSQPPRVLILSASAGAGHVRAAEAVELALAVVCPEARVVNCDVLSLTNPVFRHLYGRSYFDLVRRAPHLVGALFDRTDRPVAWPGLARARGRIDRALHLRRVSALIESEPWDVAINTHFLPAEVVGSLRESGRVAFPQVTVTTDFYVHHMWVRPRVERYYAACEEAAANLAARAPEADVEVTGIPIHPAFARTTDRGACRARHGLAHDRPVVLQLAGGLGIGPIEEVHRALLASRRPVHVVVAAGRNVAARARVERLPLPPHHRRTVFGFTSDMHELMAAADLVVSKPGGLTTSEALATGTPMLVVDPIPGQEVHNSDYLLEHGAAVKAGVLASLPYKLEALLADGDRLARMAAAARRLGRPRAAFDVARRALAVAGLPLPA